MIFMASCNEGKSDTSAELTSGKVYKNFKSYSKVSIALATGKVIQAYLAQSDQQQVQGLSGVKPAQIEDHEGMLFVYKQMGPRSFWMPNTYTDLEIIFLDDKYRVIHIERNVPAHPGMKEPPSIARTPTVYSQYVLELRSSSPLAKEIKVGDLLKPLTTF